MKARRIVSLVTAAAVAITLLFPTIGLAAREGGHATPGSPNTGETWYFAEGTTRAGFEEYLCLLNPGVSSAEARTTYMLGTGEVVSRTYQLAPASRTTVRVGMEVPPENDVSVKIESSGPIMAERPMYFLYGGSWSGGHDVVGVREPSEDWYFAEGCTRNGFDTYLCLQNPSDRDALADIVYFCGTGETITRKGIEVPADSRFTVAAHDDLLGIGRHDNERGDFSALVQSSNGVPIVAERPMYFSREDSRGGHDVFGVGSPETEWYFAEGCTRSGFDTYLCLANPGFVDARVDVSYHCGDGETVTAEGITVPGSSRFTIPVHKEEMGVGRHDSPHGEFCIEVASANELPIVAERATYFSYRPFWDGGHCVAGLSELEGSWYFAEGCTREGFDTYLCLGNLGERDAVVDIDYYHSDGKVESRDGVLVGADSRLTVPVHGPGNGAGRSDDFEGDISIEVESRNGVPLIAERTMYFAGKWRTMDRNAVAASWGWGEVYRGNTSANRIALTFDMETSGDLTSSVLDILKEKEVDCTMFVTGGFPGRWPEVVARMAEEGHEIANHSLSHPMFTKISDAQIASELAATEAAVQGVTGFTTKPYFRFPYGDRNARTLAKVNAEGYMSVYWTIDPQEWSSSATVQSVQSTILSQACNGAIVLMHDRSKTVQALPGVIDGLRAAGYELVTLSEVLASGP